MTRYLIYKSITNFKRMHYDSTDFFHYILFHRFKHTLSHIYFHGVYKKDKSTLKNEETKIF